MVFRIFFCIIDNTKNPTCRFFNTSRWDPVYFILFFNLPQLFEVSGHNDRVLPGLGVIVLSAARLLKAMLAVQGQRRFVGGPHLQRKEGFKDALEDKNANILELSLDSLLDREENTESKVDIVIALDDSNLTAIGEYLASSQPHGELLYGIGQSTEAIYYLDKGIAECVVVPDEFNVGYQSLSEVARKLDHYFENMKKQTVSYSVTRKETLFSKENQELLLTMSQ